MIFLFLIQEKIRGVDDPVTEVMPPVSGTCFGKGRNILLRVEKQLLGVTLCPDSRTGNRRTSKDVPQGGNGMETLYIFFGCFLVIGASIRTKFYIGDFADAMASKELHILGGKLVVAIVGVALIVLGISRSIPG